MPAIATFSPEEAAFWETCEREPDEDARREAYAAWLTQRGDVRGAWLRAEIDLWHEPIRPRRCRELGAKLRLLAAACDPTWLKQASRVSFTELRRRAELLTRLAPRQGNPASPPERPSPLEPPLPLVELERREAALGLRLPEQYREFVTSFADGGAGPGGGLLPLARVVGTPRDPARLATPFPVPLSPKDSPRHDHPPGAISFCETGCGGHYWLVTAGPDRGLVWEQWSSGDWWPEMVAGHSPPYDEHTAVFSVPQAAKLEFIDWYADWLGHALGGLVRSVPDDDEVFALPPEEVEEVSFAGRGLKELPTQLRNLTHLRKLELAQNQLAALPSWIGELVRLEELDLADNPLRSLPDSIGELRALRKLKLEGCQLEALPETIGQLRSLTRLNVADNRLSALPASLGQLIGLEGIRITKNQLTTLPASFARLTKLDHLTLDDNKLEELPFELAALENVTEMSLASNALRKLPACIARLPRLELLVLDKNPLLDLADACRQLEHAPALRELHLSNLGLEALPDDIGRLRQLSTLYVSCNRISRLPAAMAGLTGLRDLHTRYNGPDSDDLDSQAADLIPSLNQPDEEDA